MLRLKKSAVFSNPSPKSLKDCFQFFSLLNVPQLLKCYIDQNKGKLLRTNSREYGGYGANFHLMIFFLLLAFFFFFFADCVILENNSFFVKETNIHIPTPSKWKAMTFVGKVLVLVWRGFFPFPISISPFSVCCKNSIQKWKIDISSKRKAGSRMWNFVFCPKHKEYEKTKLSLWKFKLLHSKKHYCWPEIGSWSLLALIPQWGKTC